MGLLFAIGFMALVVANIVATGRLARDEELDPARKVLQMVLVWALPLVGVVIVLLIHLAQRAPRFQKPAEPVDALDVPDPGAHGSPSEPHDAAP